MDLRLLRFMLRLPTLPWCADKELLRVAMRGDLPEKILRRPKSPLAEDPLLSLPRRTVPNWLINLPLAPNFGNFIAQDQFLPLLRGEITPDPTVDLRPISLSLWLRLQ